MHVDKGKWDGKGTLYYQFHNYKRKFDDAEKVDSNEIKKSKKTASGKEKPLLVVEIDDAEHKRKLKFENLTFDQQLGHWRGCVASRLNTMRGNASETFQMDKFHKEWHQYATANGYLFVRIQFDLLTSA